jgi:hypothetical protein
MNQLQDYLEATMRANRELMMANSDQLTLGKLIEKIEAALNKGYKLSDESEPTVRFDFEYLHPTGIDSWRGSYNELAIGFQGHGEEPKLSEFLTMLKTAVGKEFTGWKGGEYIMSERTPVWVANPGNSGNTAIVDVVDKEWVVILVTGYREF